MPRLYLYYNVYSNAVHANLQHLEDSVSYGDDGFPMSINILPNLDSIEHKLWETALIMFTALQSISDLAKPRKGRTPYARRCELMKPELEKLRDRLDFSGDK